MTATKITLSHDELDELLARARAVSCAEVAAGACGTSSDFNHLRRVRREYEALFERLAHPTPPPVRPTTTSEALDALVGAIVQAVVTYDLSGQHAPDHGGPCAGDCTRCNLVAALPPWALLRLAGARNAAAPHRPVTP